MIRYETVGTVCPLVPQQSGEAPPHRSERRAQDGQQGASPPGNDPPRVLDLRGRAVSGPGALAWPAGDRVVVSGLPGSGKSTLMRRMSGGSADVVRIDSQDARECWARRLPPGTPYALYRPLVRLTHYWRLWRALRGGGSVLVHDCGSLSWVRRWLARDTRLRGLALHLLVLDVPSVTALAGQAARGRFVSGYAFGRHRRAVARLITELEQGRPPRGCDSAVLLDRVVATSLGPVAFGERTESD